MAGRNTRIQAISKPHKAAAWRLFFMQKFFCKSLVQRPSHSPITASAKQAARTRAAKQAFTTSRVGRRATRQSVERTRLTVSGLVAANVQAYIDMQAGKNRPCKAFRVIAYKTAHYMEFVPHLPCKRLNLHCVET